MQLVLRWWPIDSVRAVLDDYLGMRAESITGETLHQDYAYRVAWLVEVLGENTPAASVGFTELERAARAARGVLRDVTIRRRLRFWRSAVKYAIQRRVLPKDSMSDLPPWLIDDSVRCGDYYTAEQFAQFRLAVPPGRFRRFAELAMWTGMHTLDVTSMSREHLEPDYMWEGTEVRGRWWRRNNKNASPRRPTKIAPCWVPMEPELRELSCEWLGSRGPADQQLVGPLNNLRRTFHEAAARAGLPTIRPNLGLRSSHATLLLSRGYSYEYVRIVLGHVGEVKGEQVGEQLRAVTAKRPSTLSRHYLRPSPETMRPRP